MRLRFSDDEQIAVRVIEQFEGGEYRIHIESNEPALALLSRLGRMPLPPYIRRDKEHDARDDEDRARYQTVYARAVLTC